MRTAKQQAGGLYQVFEPDGTLYGTGTREYAMGAGADLKNEVNTNATWQNNPGAKPSEPAVISSENIDEEIAGGHRRLADLTKKGMTSDDKGTYYADGSLAGAPDAKPEDYSAASFYGNGDEDQADPDYLALTRLFEPLRQRLDASTLQTVNSIQSNASSLKNMQMEANRRNEQSVARALFNSGGRYTPLNTAGRMLMETSNGIQFLQILDDKENAAIASARAAQQSGDMEIMLQQLSQAEGIRKDKQTRARALADKLAEHNQKLMENEIQASRDMAVADLVKQGITDPAQILDFLNKDEQGNMHGDFTASDIEKALKSLTVDGDASKLSTDFQTFQYLQKNGLLPEDITAHAPGDQYFAYLKQLKQANSASDGGITLSTNQVRYERDENGKLVPVAYGPKGKTGSGSGSDEFGFTGTQRSNLIAGGFTDSEINDMERNLGAGGLDAVLAGIDDEDQKKLVKKVLSGTDNADGDFEITKESLRAAFGDDALRHAADTWYQLEGSITDEQISEYLDGLMQTVERYRNAGLKDKEIMSKMMSDN